MITTQQEIQEIKTKLARVIAGHKEKLSGRDMQLILDLLNGKIYMNKSTKQYYNDCQCHEKEECKCRR